MGVVGFDDSSATTFAGAQGRATPNSLMAWDEASSGTQAGYFSAGKIVFQSCFMSSSSQPLGLAALSPFAGQISTAMAAMNRRSYAG